jgi:hypothetical protein
VAYGIEADCDVCPYDEGAMTLMDYRTNYFSSREEEVRRPAIILDAGGTEGMVALALLLTCVLCGAWEGCGHA